MGVLGGEVGVEGVWEALLDDDSWTFLAHFTNAVLLFHILFLLFPRPKQPALSFHSRTFEE